MFAPDYFSSVLDLAIPVRLAARSFIIPVPEGIGSFMVYPEDIEGQPNMKRGMPICGEDGEPKGDGIVFKNYTDGAIQCVRSNGRGMIIINGVSQTQAAALSKYYISNIPEPQSATAEQILDVLHYAHEKLGIDDFFNGNQAKIPSFTVENLHPKASNCGVFIRRSDEERFALIGVGEGTYMGPASSPQRFKGHVVLVRNKEHAWMVQADAFINTYRNPDDREIKLNDLPAFKMQEGKTPTRHYKL